MFLSASGANRQKKLIGVQKKIPKPEHEQYKEWVEKYGEDAAKVIKKTVDENIADYEHLKQFAIKV
jgi:hypothetical protein